MLSRLYSLFYPTHTKIYRGRILSLKITSRVDCYLLQVDIRNRGLDCYIHVNAESGAVTFINSSERDRYYAPVYKTDNVYVFGREISASYIHSTEYTTLDSREIVEAELIKID